MFIVKQGGSKKNRFITHFESNPRPKKKVETIKPPKIQSFPRTKEKHPPQKIIPKVQEKIKIKEEEKKIIITTPIIPHNLFCIAHNQKQTTISPKKASPPQLKKKRYIDSDTGNTIGRWSREEHKKFIEAIIKFGNNWKEVQDYVTTRTSTQARSHAQKFFEKIKKNKTLKFFDCLNSDHCENFTNATILQLHDSYGNKSKSEINNVVNKFLSLEYDAPKKRRKLLNSLNGLSRKKNLDTKRNNEMMINENENYNEKNEENNGINDYEDNNCSLKYKDDIKTIIQNNKLIENGNMNLQYYQNNNNSLQNIFKRKISNEINKELIKNLTYENNPNYFDDYSQNLGYYYIINQFANSLTGTFDDLELNMKMNKRKNTFESLGDESIVGKDFINNHNEKKRKSSSDTISKILNKDKTDLNEIIQKISQSEDINHNNLPLNYNYNCILEDELTEK